MRYLGVAAGMLLTTLVVVPRAQVAAPAAPRPDEPTHDGLVAWLSGEFDRAACLMKGTKK